VAVGAEVEAPCQTQADGGVNGCTAGRATAYRGQDVVFVELLQCVFGIGCFEQLGVGAGLSVCELVDGRGVRRVMIAEVVVTGTQQGVYGLAVAGVDSGGELTDGTVGVETTAGLQGDDVIGQRLRS